MKVWNQAGEPVEMEAVDARECVQFCGYTTAAPEVSAEVVEQVTQDPATPEAPKKAQK